MSNRTQHYGYEEEHLVVFRETFTGNGADVTFQLTGNIGNATFETGGWVVTNVEIAMGADATKTTGAALYDGVNPLTRHKILVSSINASGLVTLNYPPQAENFYVWYWYDLEGDALQDYYREDYVNSVEADAGVTIASGITVDTAAFAGFLSVADNTVQQALDTLDDMAFTSDYGLTGTVTHGSIKINTSQDLQTTAGPSFDHVHLTVATGTAPLVVASTTVNTNLNADLWDGYQFADYLDQAVKQASSPTFVTVKLSGLTDGYIPYHVSDATGLADTSISISGSNLSIGYAYVNIGTADTINGQINVYGDGASSKQGGVVALYTATDYDTTIHYFTFQAYEDDLLISVGADDDALKLTSDEDLHITAGTVSCYDLTNGYVPYHVSDAAGLANSPLLVSGTYIGTGSTPLYDVHFLTAATMTLALETTATDGSCAGILFRRTNASATRVSPAGIGISGDGTNDWGKLFFKTAYNIGIANIDDDPIDMTIQHGQVILDQGDQDSWIIDMRSSDVTHPFTTTADDNMWLGFKKISANYGGARIYGFCDSSGSAAFQFEAYVGATDPTLATPAVQWNIYKSDGSTGTVVLAATETVFQVRNKTTELLTLMGGGNVYVGSGPPTSSKMSRGILINQGSYYDEILAFQSTDVSHGFTDVADASTYGQFGKITDATGGLNIIGYGEGDSVGAQLWGCIGSADPADTTPALVLAGAKLNAASKGALGAAEMVLQVRNYTTGLVSILGNGNVGIGVVAPACPLEVEDNATTAALLVKITADDATPIALVIGNDTYSTTDTNGLKFWVGNTGIAFIDVTTGDLHYGNGAAGVDYKITFDGETNDGILTWMEDEDYFTFSDDVNLATGERLLVVGNSPVLPPDDAMELFWSFDEGSGAATYFVYDVSHNARNGTIFGNPTWTDGVVGYCMNFDGTGDYVLKGSGVTLTGDTTYSCWFKATAWPQVDFSSLMSNWWYSAPANYGWGFGFRTATTLYIQGGNGAGYFATSKTVPALTAGVWYHVCVVHASGVFTIYINGVPVSTPLTQAIDHTGTDQFVVGRGIVNYANYYVNGCIDEARVYNRALTEAEVRSLYLNPSGSRGVRTTARRLTGELSVGADGTVYVGEEDSTVYYPNLVVYGRGAGSVVGGYVLLHLAADHDGTIATYGLRAYEDDFLIGPDTDTDALKLTSDKDFHITAGTVSCYDLTDGYVPYHVSDAAGLANSILQSAATGITIGTGAAGVDYTLTFDGETANGVLTWMEDEDFFKFSDDILIDSTEKLQFRDTAIYLYSANDGYLDIVADTGIRLSPVLAVTYGGTGAATLADGGLLVGAGTGAIEVLAVGLTTQILVGGGAATNPAWGTDLPTAVTIGTAYIYRVGGTDVSAADGGTGASTLTDHGVLVGSGTDPITPLAVGATGEYLAGSTGADPAWATLNQAAVAGLTTTDSPAFVTVKLSGLTDGYVPYHVADATGLANSAILQDASSNVGIHCTPNAKLEIEDGGTAMSMVVKITQDDATLYGLIIGNDTYSTTDTLGLQFYVNNTGSGYVQNSGAGDLLLAAYGTANVSNVILYTENSVVFSDYNGGAPVTALTITPNSATVLTVGGGAAGVDYVLTFDGETNNGTITWMEDEAVWAFSNTASFANLTDNYFPYHVSNAAGLANSVLSTDGTGLFCAGPFNVTIGGNPYFQVQISPSFAVKVGRSETSAGAISIYGHGTGTALGAALYLYVALDYKGTIVYYKLQASEDDLLIGPAGDPDAFKLDSNKDLYLTAGNAYIYGRSAGVLTLGSGAAGVDYALTFNGETNDGTITWMEDENWFQFNRPLRMATSLYRRYYHMPITSVAPGASGATWVDPGANSTGGWQLDAVGEVVVGQADVHSDWDGASDLQIEVRFYVNVDNSGGGAGDTVDLKGVIRYKGTGDTAVKSQTVEVATVVGASAQYKAFVALFTIDWNYASNVVEAGDNLSVVLNLETDTSEVDDVVITGLSFSYLTTHTGIENGDE